MSASDSTGRAGVAARIAVGSLFVGVLAAIPLFLLPATSGGGR